MTERTPNEFSEPTALADFVAPDTAAQLTEQNFRTQADDVLDALENPRFSIQEITKEYVFSDENAPALSNLADVLVSASQIAKVSRRLDGLADVRGKDAYDEKRALKPVAARFNGKLRNLIYANPDRLQRADLTDWLARASGWDETWAERTVRGVAAEVAARRELETEVPGILYVRFSTTEEDLGSNGSKGKDVIAVVPTERGTREVAFDIKSSENGTHGGFSISKDGLILAILPEHINEGFCIRPDFRGHVFPQAVFR